MTDAWILRGSAGTGFRAPTPGQISSVSVQSVVNANEPRTAGIFPADDPASRIFGSVPLTDETSEQLSIGLAFQPSDAFTMTLDYYFIALDDRIWVSSRFDVGPDERAQLIALGAPGADQLTSVRFFNNDMDTETQGIDLVAQYGIDWSAGNTLLSLAVNYNETKVTRRTNRQTDPNNPDPVYFLREVDVFRLEEGSPQYRANITAMHSWTDNLSATLRGNWYSNYTYTPNNQRYFQEVSSAPYWDLDVTWHPSDVITLTLGGRNVFDAAPDPFDVSDTCCGAIVDGFSVMDWQGPYYYLRGIFNWN